MKKALLKYPYQISTVQQDESLGGANLGGESTKELQGIDTSASTFYCEGPPRKFGVDIVPKESEEAEEAFLVEEQEAPEAETSYFEESDSPQKLPLLTPAPTLRDTSLQNPYKYVPNKLRYANEDWEIGRT